MIYKLGWLLALIVPVSTAVIGPTVLSSNLLADVEFPENTSGFQAKEKDLGLAL